MMRVLVAGHFQVTSDKLERASSISDDAPLQFGKHICWRSGFNLKTSVKTADFYLTHVVCEDLGLTVGRAFGEYIKKASAEGVFGYGDATSILDEARATVAVSFESRALFDFDSAVDVPTDVEGMLSEELMTFLDGFAQGACCTLHIEAKKGENAHHIWEAVFRAFGSALMRACKSNPSRAGMTSGVAGKIEFEVE